MVESFEKHVLAGEEYESSIFQTIDKTKLAAIDFSDTSYVLYDLPGNLPCTLCLCE